MKEIKILHYGKHPEILKTVLRLINKNLNWAAKGAVQEEYIIKLAKQNSFDLLLLGAGITDFSEEKVKSFVRQIQPKIKIVQHYGGGSGLLKSEILSALQNQAIT